ncbi:MAG: hypothetical protein ABI333_22350 [bacterium]
MKCSALVLTLLLGGCSLIYPFERLDDEADASPFPLCDNGVLDPGEQCDGDDLQGQTCESLSYDGGELRCAWDCRYNLEACVGDGACGNGIRDLNEDCEGDDLNYGTCEGTGFGSGVVSCSVDCRLDYSQCSDVLALFAEYQINTITAGNQHTPRGDQGVIVWVDESGIPDNSGSSNIRYRDFGSETDFGQIAHVDVSGNEVEPVVVASNGMAFFFVDSRPQSADPDGLGVFVTHCDDWECPNASTVDLSFTTQLVSPPMSAGDQHQVRVSPVQGPFVVWRDTSAHPTIYAARYPPFMITGEVIAVSTAVEGDRSEPTVAGMDVAQDDIRALVAWTESASGMASAIYYRIGVMGDSPHLTGFLGDEDSLSTHTGGDQSQPAAAGVGGRDYCWDVGSLFMVVWRDASGQGEDPDQGGIRGRLVDVDGLALGAELQINTTTAGDQRLPRVQAFYSQLGCRVLVVWEDHSGADPDPDGAAIRGRLFDIHGTPLERNGSSDDFVINQGTAGDQRHPWIVTNSWDTMIAHVLWEDWSETAPGAEGSEIMARPVCLLDAVDCPTLSIQF